MLLDVPSAPEAERAVLGAMLMDPTCIPTALEALEETDFHNERHRVLFRALGEMFERNAATDPVAVSDHLTQSGDIDRVGGMAYVSEMLNYTVTSGNLEYHAGVVRDRAVRRALIQAGQTIAMDAGAEDTESATDKLDRASQRIFDLAVGRIEGGPVSVKTALKPAMEDIERREKSGGGITGVPTGFADVDQMTGGVQRGDLWLVAARPSMGKTSIVTGIALHAAITEQVGVAIFSLEMSKEQIVHRMLCHEALVDLGNLLRGKLKDDDYVRLARAAKLLNHERMWIDDRGSISAMGVRAAARRVKAQNPDTALVIVDYIQLMHGGDAENRNQEISQISRGLKTMARELDVGVIALSQLSRKVEERSDKRPMLSDLRDSGALEQDADVVGFVHRPEQYMTPMEAEDKGVAGHAEFIISKQRNGPTGAVDLYFRKECARFESMSRREEAA